MRESFRFVLSSLALLAATQAGAAVVIDYPNFTDTTGLKLNGNAASVGDVLRVTPAIDGQAGSVFSLNKVSLASNASFSTFFQFRFTNPDTGFCDGQGCGADGLVFVVQTLANNVGGAGGGIGYFGIAKSVGIEFDTWNNGAGDNNSSNHVGIDIAGSVNSVALREVTEADMNAGDVWSSWIDYNGATQQLEVRLNRTGVRPTDSFLTLTRDLAGDLGSLDAFVGFTSGTGSSNANHDLLNWKLSDNYAPISDPVPEPSTVALMLAGLAGIGAAARRRR